MVFNTPQHKSLPVFDYIAPDRGKLEKHVLWLRRKSEGIAKIGKLALIALECLVAAVSLVGIYYLVKAVQLNRGFILEKKFEEMVKSKRASCEDIEISVKSKSMTFNHIKQFIIHDEVIWHRRHGERQWQPLFFDGFSKGEIPVQISCDGANLVALDQNHRVHYKKILNEYRSSEVDLQTNRHLKESLSEPKECVVDKTGKNNWKPKWFTAPYVHHIGSVILEKRLSLPKDTKYYQNSPVMSISSRGRYNNYLEDKLGRHHPVAEGVTTLYTLCVNGREIRKFDPWSPNFADVRIQLPRTSHTSFEAINMDASASSIMVIGYEKQRGSDQKQLKIYTKLSDIDSEGWNPFLKYDYWVSNDDPNLRILPIDPHWQEHPLPEGKMTGTISIHQSGEGNHARELRVVGINNNGENGYWWKSLSESTWHFKSSAAEKAEVQFLLPVTLETESLTPDAATVVEGKFKLDEKSIEGVLTPSGNGSNHFNFEFRLQNQSYILEVHLRKGLKTFLGMNGDYYEAFVPDRYKDDPTLIKLIGKKRLLRFAIT